MSRWCEEMVLWSSQQFNFIALPDRFCTGSSIMPQKKNPDVPELIRGKTGRVNGHLISLLTLMKSQPLAYNKDNQEDKEPLFDAIDTLGHCLTALIGMVPNIKANKEIMLEATLKGFTTATDWQIIWYARVCRFVTLTSWLGERCSWPLARQRVGRTERRRAEWPGPKRDRARYL